MVAARTVPSPASKAPAGMSTKAACAAAGKPSSLIKAARLARHRRNAAAARDAGACPAILGPGALLRTAPEALESQAFVGLSTGKGSNRADEVGGAQSAPRLLPGCRL